MKTIINTCITGITATLLFSACASPSRVVVREHPVVVRPAAPYPGAVWITEEYRGRPGRYRYVAPHYVRPRTSRAWTPGYWNNGPKGKIWIRGRWN